MMTDDEKAKLDYFQKHALPWQIEHIKFRAIGIQIFVAAQAGLFAAWATKPSHIFAIIGILACLSFWFWDSRNRYIINQVHIWGQKLADRHFFECDTNGNPKDGVHVAFAKTLSESGKCCITPSHTLAIRVLLLPIAVAWLLFIICPSVADIK